MAALPSFSQLIHLKEDRLGSPDRHSLRARGEQPAALAFGYSPLLESVLSLHVLAEPKHHALQHGWVRAMRRLPAGLRREIADLSFLYRWTLPNVVLPSATTPYEEFDAELGRLRALRPEVAALELLRPIYDHGGVASRRILADPDVQGAALKQAGTIGRGAACGAPPVRESRRARRAVRRLAGGLLGGGLRGRVARLEPRLAESVTAAGRQIAGEGLRYAFLLGWRRSCESTRPAARSGWTPHDHRVPLDAGQPLLLVPSFFVWPHVRVNRDPPAARAGVPRAAPHRGSATANVTRARTRPAGARRPDAAADAPADRAPAAQHAGAGSAGRPERGRNLEAAPRTRRGRHPRDAARGLLRRLLPRRRSGRGAGGTTCAGSPGRPRRRRRRPAHGRASSSWAARRRRSPSPSGGPIRCIPIGRSPSHASGTEIAGWPVTLTIAVNGVNGRPMLPRASSDSWIQPIGTGFEASVGVTTTS